MYRHYFPPCPVNGPIEPPVPFGHLTLRGAVPTKCSECQHLFEGECTRYIADVGHYLHLDHGPCGINGATDPVVYEDDFITSKVQIPSKCANCVFLGVDRTYGLHCQQDADKWGAFHRGLDWGSWAPDCIFLQLQLPKATTRELSLFAQRNDFVAFIKEHRRINPGLSIKDAKADFIHLRTVIEKHGQRVVPPELHAAPDDRHLER